MENIEFAYWTEPKEGVRYKLTEFAPRDFLTISLARKNYPETFACVEISYYGNEIFIDITDKDFNAIGYLEQFGCVQKLGTVRIWDTQIDYAYADFDKVNDLDYTEFTITE